MSRACRRRRGLSDRTAEDATEINWRAAFLSLNVSVQFDVAESEPEQIDAHLARLIAANTQVVLFITPTARVELYSEATQRQQGESRTDEAKISHTKVAERR